MFVSSPVFRCVATVALFSTVLPRSSAATADIPRDVIGQSPGGRPCDKPAALQPTEETQSNTNSTDAIQSKRAGMHSDGAIDTVQVITIIIHYKDN